MAACVTTDTVVSYTAFPPLPIADPASRICYKACGKPHAPAILSGKPENTVGGIFLLHYPGSYLRRTLSGILPFEARTFLTCALSGPAAAIIRPAHTYVNLYVFELIVKSYTLKQLPPTNSLQMELCGSCVESTLMK